MRAHKTRSGCESFGPARAWCRRPSQLQAERPDANHAVTALYLAHYRPLVRLAVLLVQDLAAAEDIVQDAFVAVHAAWRRLPDADHALSYLRRSVIDRSRSALRDQAVADKLGPANAPATAGVPGGPGAAGGALGAVGASRGANVGLERSAFVSALWTLPTRQREVVVLRYFADLPETAIASATGISEAAVRSHAVQAMSSLRAELGGAR
jgi:RNA polymerase sigma factor (sigma-70 family)